MKNQSTKAKSKVNRELLLRVLTDPKLRKLLEDSPEKALNKKTLSDLQKQEVKKLLTLAKDINANISKLADEILCANGPCGIA